MSGLRAAVSPTLRTRRTSAPAGANPRTMRGRRPPLTSAPMQMRPICGALAAGAPGSRRSEATRRRRDGPGRGACGPGGEGARHGQ